LGIDQTIESEGLDRVEIGLPGVQNALVEALLKVNSKGKNSPRGDQKGFVQKAEAYFCSPPVIVILINGGPVGVDYIKENVPGIIEVRTLVCSLCADHILFFTPGILPRRVRRTSNC
jgi:hypothetical protein